VNLGGEESPSVDLRAYLTALWRRKVAVLLCLGLVMGTAMVLSYRKTPQYRASSQLLLKARLRSQIAGTAQQVYVDPDRAQKTEIQVLNSPDVRAAVEKRIGPHSGVFVRPLPDTDIILVDAVDRDPKRAAEVANTYADVYVDLRQAQAVTELEAAGTAVQARITELGKQIEELTPPPAAPGTATTRPDAARGSQLEEATNQQILLKQKLSEIQVETSLNSGGVQVVALAGVPGAPFSPDHRRDAMLAIAVGVMFAVGGALLWEFLDDAIDSKDDLARLAPEVPILAAVPPVRNWKDRGRPLVVSLTDDRSPAAEAYKSLRTAIHFARLEQQISLIQVTSASAAEGKTSTVANLGVALARAGNRVVIVCCDLRRPRIHEFFGLTNDVGFVSVLLGETALSAAIQSVPGQPRLALLSAGPPPPNPSELLTSRRAGDVFAALRKNADIVLVDCPPVLPVTDAVVLSEKVDATLLVVYAGTTTRRRLHHAVEQLRQVNAPLIGMVLNGAAAEGGYGYSYTYGRTGAKPSKASAAAPPPANGHVPIDTGFAPAPPNGATHGNGNGVRTPQSLPSERPQRAPEPS
jgi:capsular exopolysaccharide synthesis family protein